MRVLKGAAVRVARDWVKVLGEVGAIGVGFRVLDSRSLIAFKD